MSLLALLEPLPPVQTRASELADRLTDEIKTRLEPGARLPTEQEMMSAFGVSRTVVREAVAALRAEGLVETRQGVGAFVTRDVQRRPFRIDPAAVSSIADVLHVMELRTGVEVEAAGIAAERVSTPARERIGRALLAFDAAVRRGESAIEEDFRFHQSIAAATGNPQFVRFLEFLGRFLIPRQSVRLGLQRQEDLKAYLQRIQLEHRRIYDAIRDRDSTAARRAMRAHLMGSRRRYRRFAAAEKA
ncbi:MAG TPA: FadR/GntR family transcriptional regulator [Casimicrobiaceae bacterium]|nr:FadR/GntR family transcriptional regulator [Casimicrobiaceae bacterium]